VGNLYLNDTVRGPTQAEIGSAIRESGRSAFVSPIRDGSTVIYDR